MLACKFCIAWQICCGSSAEQCLIIIYCGIQWPVARDWEWVLLSCSCPTPVGPATSTGHPKASLLEYLFTFGEFVAWYSVKYCGVVVGCNSRYKYHHTICPRSIDPIYHLYSTLLSRMSQDFLDRQYCDLKMRTLGSSLKYIYWLISTISNMLNDDG